jgi:predicted outer membrane protein
MIRNFTRMCVAAMAATAVLAAPARAEKGPTDMQIAHIAYTAGNLDIRYAHLALAKSDNPEVRKFAELMIQDHTAINQLAVELLTKLGATPEDIFRIAEPRWIFAVTSLISSSPATCWFRRPALTSVITCCSRGERVA